VVARLRRLLYYCAFGAALALVAILATQNRSLRDRYGDLAERATRAHAGIFVPTFQSTTLTGAPVTIGAAEGERQVLFFYRSDCPYSRASIPAWNRIAEAADSRADLSAYGVALDSLHVALQHAAEHDLRFPVTTLPERKLATLYRIVGVPLTMVLDKDGRVLYVRTEVVAGDAAIDSVLSAGAD